MKKIINFMTAILAVFVINTSCSSSDDYDYESFVTNLISGTWEGPQMSQYKEMGGWVNNQGEYVVLQFSRTGSQLSGTGTHICYDSSYKTKETERSDFRWYISGENIYIEYAAGWNTVYAKCADCNINSTILNGYWYLQIKQDSRIKFDYTKK